MSSGGMKPLRIAGSIPSPTRTFCVISIAVLPMIEIGTAPPLATLGPWQLPQKSWYRPTGVVGLGCPSSQAITAVKSASVIASVVEVGMALGKATIADGVGRPWRTTQFAYPDGTWRI